MEIKFKASSKEKNITDAKVYLDDFKQPKFSIRKLLSASDTVYRPYIGLKDKNEKEIYLNDDFKAFNQKFKVVFVNGAFGYNSPSTGFCAFASHGSLTIIDNCIQEIEVVDD